MLPLVLQHNQVFVFGSNGAGFHGAGMAGYAWRGTIANDWRQDDNFTHAIMVKLSLEPGETHPDLIGKWAVFGRARGYQVGKQGASYAIQTVVRPGMKKSIQLVEIWGQLETLKDFSEENADLEFLIAPIGTGYAGWKEEDISMVWKALRPHPDNWKFIDVDE